MSHPFTAGDLRRWEAHTVPAWVYKGVLLAGWAFAFGYAVTRPTTCTPAAPCEPDPWLAVFTAALLATPVLLWREPGLGCAVGAVFGLAEVLFEADEGIRLAFGLHGLACALVALWLVEARRAQHRVFGEIGTPTVVPREPPVRFTGRTAVAALMLLVGLVAMVKYVVDAGELATHAAVATQVDGTVTKVGEMDVAVRLPSGREQVFQVIAPASYAVGSDVPLLVDGDWAELVAEPRDVTFPLTAMTASLGMAVFLRLRDVAGRRAWQRVLAGPAPAVEVLVRADARGRAVLHTADGRPFASIPVSPPPEDDRVLAVGDLSHGGWVVLSTADRVLLPNRPLRPHHRDVPRPDEPGEELLGVALEVPPLPYPVQPHRRDVVASRWLFAAAVLLTAGATAVDGPVVLTALWTAGTCALAGWVRGRPSAVFHADHVALRSWLRNYRVPWAAVTSIRRDGQRLVLELDDGSRFTLAPARRPVTELGAIARRLHDLAPAGDDAVTSRIGGALPVLLWFAAVAGAVLLLT
ncbi:PH domain-containing protein [Saccharothrix obliqua]|uniref:PH domain-containing protein n=1 Tax=Saccharothrix obliqua TaxID=2861747 RepID=UPI001C60779A|nr:PH domain-containing protein [Saccharothrix obliqua]MBW4721998.1 PH domain-containing protein [Saccharothrix obliqua]